MTKLSAATQSAVDSLPQAIASVIVPIIAPNPLLAAPILAIVGIYGWSVVYRQERFNQLMQSIADNPKAFTEKVIASREFQDALVVFIDDYFKIRDDTKLLYARNIFYDFASSSKKPFYPLERYNDTLLKISDASIQFLGFIDTDIPKIKEKYVLDKMRQNNNPLDDESKDKFREIYTKSESLDKFVSIYIDERVKREAILSSEYSTGPLIVEEDVKKTIATEIELTVSELEQLGIISRYSYQTQGWSSNYVSGYNLTHYGRMFMSVIRPN